MSRIARVYALKTKRPETKDGSQIPVMPLKYGEYEGMKWMRGLMGYAEVYMKVLEERFRVFPHDWAMMRAATAMYRKCLDRIIWTMEPRMKERLARELDNSELYIKIKCVGEGIKPDTHTYIDIHALHQALEIIEEDKCTFCELEGKDAKKCKMRQCLNDLMTWDIDIYNDKETCPFEGVRFASIKAGLELELDRQMEE